MSLDNYPVAQPTFLEREAVCNLAERLAEKLEFAPGGDLDPVLTMLGGKARYEDTWNPNIDSSGSLYVHDVGNFEILLPLDTTVERDRFTIAHEIGHYILHFLWRRPKDETLKCMRATRYGSGRVEWEANWFAASFLMPENKFKEAFKKEGGHLARVCKSFSVSYSAAEIRAKALALIDSGSSNAIQRSS